MSTSYCLLDAQVKETIGENNTTYFFQRDEHAKCLLENLSQMQLNEGRLTDAVVCTGSKEYEENFHSMLLAACSPVVKKRLVDRASMATEGRIVLKDMTKEMLDFFRHFIYKSEVIVDAAVLNLDDLFNFAVKYDIVLLQVTCEECKDSQAKSPLMEVIFHDHEDVLVGLFEMFLEKELTTTVLEDDEGKTQFEVHGPLIAAASPILQDALLGDSSTGHNQTIRLEISSAALGDLIEYIYSAKITLQDQNVVGLLKAACIFEMPALAKVCCDWLVKRLDAHDDVVSILCLARELDSEFTEELEEAVKSYIVVNFSELSTDEKFNSLLYEDLKEIIEDEELDIETEEQVFGVVMKWIEWDENSRLNILCNILPSIRLEQTSIEFLDAIRYDPRIAKCRQCLQEIDGARQKLIAALEKSSPHTGEGFDDTCSLEPPRSVIEDGQDNVSSVSEEFYRRSPPPHEDVFGDTSSYQGTFPFLDDDDGFSSVSATFSRNSSLRDTPDDDYQPTERGLRKDGQPDMRFKENRKLYLEEGTNRDGSLDKRVKENKERAPGPLKKNGTPDMRFKANREAFGHSRRTTEFSATSNNRQRVSGPLKKNGTPDMRFKANREEFGHSERATAFSATSNNRQRVSGPLKKNGTPDMRFKENKDALTSSYPRSSFSSSVPGARCFGRAPYSSGCRTGPLRKDGLPDMRFRENKEAFRSASPRSSVYSSVHKQSSVGVSFASARPPSFGSFVGPVRKNGAPDMRYTFNKQLYGASPMTSSVPRGPLKKNGTPDMRYTVNKQAYGLAPPSSMARGPLKKNGTPDMRFKANRK